MDHKTLFEVRDDKPINWILINPSDFIFECFFFYFKTPQENQHL